MGKVQLSTFLNCLLLFVAGLRGMYNHRFDCQFCASPSFLKPKDLDNHERRAHAHAIAVNRRGVPASIDMELCTVCNLYLDPGVFVATSSHLRTTYYLQKITERFPFSVHGASSPSLPSIQHLDREVVEGDGAVDVIAHFEAARFQREANDCDEEECNKRLLDDCDDGAGADDGYSRTPGNLGDVSHVDWMLDRNDKLQYGAHPDIGYVFLCPFDFDRWADLTQYPAASLEPLNYARYRFVALIPGANGVEVTFTKA